MLDWIKNLELGVVNRRSVNMVDKVERQGEDSKVRRAFHAA